MFIVIGLVAFGLAACGSSSKASTPSTPIAPSSTITISNFTFSAATVKAGATVTVDNTQSGVTHTVTADNGEFDTGNVDGGSTKTFTAPSKPGTYKFHCNVHASMHGTLTVTA